MIFGKTKETNEWGFDISSDIFDIYKEIPDSDYHELLKKAQEQEKLIAGDENCNPILVDPPVPSQEEIEKMRINELKGYLDSTDWYVIRFAETGKVIPTEIKTKRQNARNEISLLKKKYTV